MFKQKLMYELLILFYSFYEDVCGLLGGNSTIAQIIIFILDAAGVPTECPVPPFELLLTDVTVPLPTLPGAVAPLVEVCWKCFLIVIIITPGIPASIIFVDLKTSLQDSIDKTWEARMHWIRATCGLSKKADNVQCISESQTEDKKWLIIHFLLNKIWEDHMNNTIVFCCIQNKMYVFCILGEMGDQVGHDWIHQWWTTWVYWIGYRCWSSIDTSSWWRHLFCYNMYLSRKFLRISK